MPTATEFYAAVRAAIERREAPDIEFSEVEWNEKGVLSAKRTYLRVRRGRISFDICVAPSLEQRQHPALEALSKTAQPRPSHLNRTQGQGDSVIIPNPSHEVLSTRLFNRILPEQE